MGRKRLQLKKIDKTTSLQITYSKRKEGLIRKIKELSVLCDTDAGLLMFSPAGKLSCTSSSGRIEDIFLRYINEPDELQGSIENEESLRRRLKHSKCEGEILELLETIYQPDVRRINSIHEAVEHERHLTDAIQRIAKQKEKLQDREKNHFKVPKHAELQSVRILDRSRTTEGPVSYGRMRNPLMDENRWEETCLPTGPPQLGTDDLNNQSLWNFSTPSAWSAPNPLANFNKGHASQVFGQGFPF
ncbi:hypothetical protein JRO89_XS01G0152500 [Xanthoceras sorbifolium]|uniref:MADS-box domain-containing protein n=1 Tax=Xanthoceras sorbifolium TaxID=99658 RepID=A0ABQ8IJC2_9ROSI|nr:hypothetical protein JRO89_XS01G0152500 [Xanthoceras sorbifolium]